MPIYYSKDEDQEELRQQTIDAILDNSSPRVADLADILTDSGMDFRIANFAAWLYQNVGAGKVSSADVHDLLRRDFNKGIQQTVEAWVDEQHRQAIHY